MSFDGFEAFCAKLLLRELTLEWALNVMRFVGLAIEIMVSSGRGLGGVGMEVGDIASRSDSVDGNSARFRRLDCWSS